MKDEIKHYNHNHDPRNGRFTFGSGSAFKPGEKGKNSPAQNIAKAGQDFSSAALDLEKHTRKNKRYKLSNMSDEELRRSVNRMKMEQQYHELKEADIARGRQNVEQTLRVVGDVAAIAGSVALIGTAVYKIRNPA